MTALTDLREQVAAALDTVAEVAAGDWAVIPAPVDAVEPPAYMLVWGPDPWGVPTTMCNADVHVETLVVAARLEPEANYPVLEAMVDGAVAALHTARLAPYEWLAPGPLEIAQVTYLGARLRIRRPITIGGHP